MYKYFFILKDLETKTEEEKIIYAESEKEARKKFKKFFEVEAGDLIRRENW